MDKEQFNPTLQTTKKLNQLSKTKNQNKNQCKNNNLWQEGWRLHDHILQQIKSIK